MSLFKYLTSKTFFLLKFFCSYNCGCFYIFSNSILDFRTNHGQEIKVPSLSKMKLEVAEEK